VGDGAIVGTAPESLSDAWLGRPLGRLRRIALPQVNHVRALDDADALSMAPVHTQLRSLDSTLSRVYTPDVMKITEPVSLHR